MRVYEETEEAGENMTIGNCKRIIVQWLYLLYVFTNFNKKRMNKRTTVTSSKEPLKKTFSNDKNQ